MNVSLNSSRSNWSLPRIESKYTREKKGLSPAKDPVEGKKVKSILKNLEGALDSNEPITGDTREALKKILANSRDDKIPMKLA